MDRSPLDSPYDVEDFGEQKSSECETASGSVSATPSDAPADEDSESGDVHKRKRRPRRRAAPLRNGPLLCLVCGDVALG